MAESGYNAPVYSQGGPVTGSMFDTHAPSEALVASLLWHGPEQGTPAAHAPPNPSNPVQKIRKIETMYLFFENLS